MGDNTGSGSQDEDNHSTAKRRKTSIGDDDESHPEMKYYLNESESDVVFVIDGQRVPAIKAVLRLKSVVFGAMFSGKYSESKTKEIQITDSTADAFKTMIRFIYTQELIISDAKDLKLIGDALQCADKYRVIPLFNAISKLLEPLISIETMESIADMTDNYENSCLSDTLGTGLAALLTTEHLLSVARVGYKYTPNERFVSALKTFMEKNLQQIAAKECEYLIELNEKTNNLWLRVMDDVAKGRSPSGYHMIHTVLGSGQRLTVPAVWLPPVPPGMSLVDRNNRLF